MEDFSTAKNCVYLLSTLNSELNLVKRTVLRVWVAPIDFAKLILDLFLVAIKCFFYICGQGYVSYMYQNTKHKYSGDILTLACHVVKRINTVADPGFPKGGGRQLLKGCANLLSCKKFAENYMKSKEFGPRVESAALVPP